MMMNDRNHRARSWIPGAVGALLLVIPLPAYAADVVAVTVTTSSNGGYYFEVTVRSDETGWDKYADRWEVLAPDGTVLGTRVLHHPHVEEQPFTRGLRGVTVPDHIEEVIVRAHDSVEGFVGEEMSVQLPGR